ncbi:MAG: hypothetical protein CMC08_09395 [Flavobacteriaceae bacterium]|nr:hypothetical protein [Flavobacteriaceae bacterium]
MSKKFEVNFKEKRVLIILHTGILGGAERQGLGLCKILTEKYQCRVYLLLTFSDSTTREFDEFAEQCHVREIFFFGKPYLLFKRELSTKNLKRFVWSAKYLLRMRKGLLPYKIDFIFPFLNFPSKIAFYLYKLLPTAKFTFWHQLGLDSFSKDWFESVAARYSPAVIANSETGLELFRNVYRLEKSRAFILPQYVSLELTHHNNAQVREKFGFNNDDILIGMVAHYRPDKLHFLLLNAFQGLTDNYSEVRLLFLGNRNANKRTSQKFYQIQQAIDDKELSKRVSLMSGQAVDTILSILDIGVLVSEIEGLPNSVMEYMLYGLPVVATNHPGCKDLLGQSEFLVENDLEQVKSALSKLIASQELRTQEGEKNKLLIKKFTADEYLMKFEKIVDAI